MELANHSVTNIVNAISSIGMNGSTSGQIQYNTTGIINTHLSLNDTSDDLSNANTNWNVCFQCFKDNNFTIRSLSFPYHMLLSITKAYLLRTRPKASLYSNFLAIKT